MILKIGYSFFLGSLLIIAFEPFNVWALAFIVPFLLKLNIENKSPLATGLIGYFFGLGFWLFGVFWIENSINVYGGADIFTSTALTVLLTLFLSLFQGVSFFLFGLLKRNNLFSDFLLFPSIWVLSEWLREFIFSGFPWLYLGYSSLDNFLVNGYVPILGVFGASFIIVTLSMSLKVLFFNYQRPLSKPFIFSISLILFFYVSNTFLKDINWTEPKEVVDVVLVQPNIGIKEKWTSEGEQESSNLLNATLFNESSRLINDSKVPKLFFFPEAFLPGKFSDFQILLKPILSLTERANIGVTLGAISENEENYELFNSLISFGIIEGKYNKEKLVPFGEFVPSKFFDKFFNFFNFNRPQINSGEDNKIFESKDFSFYGSICYEVAYQDLYLKYAAKSNFLFTASNDAWFGQTIGPHQHLQIARFRALESRKPLIRSTTSGISAIVNTKGETLKFIELDNDANEKNNPEFISHRLTIFEGTTPFIRYGKMPLLFIITFILIIFGLFKLKEKV